MQRYPSNPIEQRKQDVRKYSSAAAVWAGVGVVGGIAAALLVNVAVALVVIVAAVAGCGINYARVQRIINHKDKY